MDELNQVRRVWSLKKKLAVSVLLAMMLTVLLAPVVYAGEEDIPRIFGVPVTPAGEEDIPRIFSVPVTPAGEEDIPRIFSAPNPSIN
jgi:hypothetical protein